MYIIYNILSHLFINTPSIKYKFKHTWIYIYIYTSTLIQVHVHCMSLEYGGYVHHMCPVDIFKYYLDK